MPGKFWGIIGQDPSDSNPAGYMLTSFRLKCFHSFEEVYSSIDSSKMIGNSPELSNFDRLFLKLDRFIYNYSVLPGHRVKY